MGASLDKINYGDIAFNEEIGQGQFGCVSRVTIRNSMTGCTQAVAKSIFKLRKDEINALSKLDHPNIVTVLGMCCREPLDVILLEFAENGNLFEYLSDESTPLTSELIKRWANESALAIHYLHEHDILHRGLEPRNCLLFKDNLLKLSEFGLVRKIDHSKTISNQKVSYRYMAPEIYKENDKGRAVYSQPAEIYAYGMLLLEICTRRKPFDGMSCAQVVFGVENGILEPTIPSNCPERLSMIMKCCWKYDRNERPTIGYILSALTEYTLVRKIIPTHHLKILRVFNVACSPSGDMVIASGIKKLHILNKDGTYKRRLKTTETECEKKIGMVLSIAISSSKQIFVVDSRRYVKVFDVDGKYLHCFSTIAAGELSDATIVNLGWISIDGDGLLVIDDRQREVKTIHRCPDGKLIQTVKQTNYGSMFVCNKKCTLYHFRPSGSLNTKVVAVDHYYNELFSFTPRIDEAMATGDKIKARGIACDREDNIYVAVSLTNESLIYSTGHVHKYSPIGVFIGCIAKDLLNPCDISVAYDGTVVIANQDSLLIYDIK